MSPAAPTGQITPNPKCDPASGLAPADAADFTLNIYPSREDWSAVEGWMADEGWDPGAGDALAVTALDNRALVIGMLRDQPVSAISLLNVGAAYSFLGNYIVRPDFRGRGFGLATWRSALPHARDRVIGLDSVPGRLETYRGAGFTDAHTTLSYQGAIAPLRGRLDLRIRPFEPGDRAAVTALDALCSPHERAGFLAAWFAAPATRTLVYQDRGEVTGFGSIRPSRAGHRIGPLIANTPQVAAALYDALTADFVGDLVCVNCPEPNTAGCDLARARGLIRISHTVRMYSAPVRPTGLARCYSTASLAYG